MIKTHPYIPPLSAILLNGYSYNSSHRKALLILNVHNMAQNYAWAAAFKQLSKHPELINSICETTDTTLPIIAATQGNLYILEKLSRNNSDIDQVTYSGRSVFDAVNKIDDMITMVKTVTWLKGNSEIEYRDPLLYADSFKSFELTDVRH